ncbi:cobalamin-dependent protein [Calderihabitans maritimus]|uniref:Methyltransferase cognate corrinoid protein n=1 Tax=Calderihabitans maritimus TaxID=1246530 RepID=A0A1Z5HP48_9FIRM|nr:cobalamin-dependent protein [Calderihabitans maritimus]GAW91050.1 methyltransferase cognate corrinoid protein [Calderihabitans maritimus]
MLTPEKEQELLRRLKEGVINYDETEVIAASREVLQLGMDVHRAVFDGLVAGMEEVGRLYEEQIYFIPEMLMCADALYAGLDILRPHLRYQGETAVKGKVIIGVVRGDIHDIGKNLVRIMFEVAGFEVVDLGRDVSPERFVAELMNTDANLICISAMMTTTMTEMPEVIRQVKERKPEAKIMVGGAPLTEELAAKFGADGYSPDANNAVKDAINLLRVLKEVQSTTES